MKLPERVEAEIRAIEQELGQLPGQQAGSPRLRALRCAIEDALREGEARPDKADALLGTYSLHRTMLTRIFQRLHAAFPGACECPSDDESRECARCWQFGALHEELWAIVVAPFDATNGRKRPDVDGGHGKQQQAIEPSKHGSFVAGEAQTPPNQGCTLPPDGWWCSREPGHDGPCAARPVCPHGGTPGACSWCDLRDAGGLPEAQTPPAGEPCRVCRGYGFVAEKQCIDDGYGEVDVCPACQPPAGEAQAAPPAEPVDLMDALRRALPPAGEEKAQP